MDQAVQRAFALYKNSVDDITAANEIVFLGGLLSALGFKGEGERLIEIGTTQTDLSKESTVILGSND